MTTPRTIPPAFTKGYALCNPAGRLLPKSWRNNEADAIATRFRVRKTREAKWEKAQADGWSIQHVYVRVFVPVFKSTHPTTETSEVDDVEDV